MNIFCALVLTLLASSVSAKDRLLSKNAQAVAQTQENVPEESQVRRLKNGKKVVKLQPDEVLDGSSEYNRQDKLVSATWEMFGLVDYFVTGWSLGYYITPDSIMELNIVSETDRSERRLTSLRLKSFWGNSFYTNLGLGQRTRSYTSYPSVYQQTNDDYLHVSVSES